ncbi:MAG: hypothetical protein AABZ08_09325 [Planctomycetota bacterium]
MWGLTKMKSAEATQGVQVPKEFTVDALKNTPPEQAFDTFRKAMDRDDLTDEQREKIRENGREVMEQRIDAEINEYFACKDKEARNKLLDKQIDEMQKRFEKMRQERESRDEKMSEEEREKERQKWRDRMQGRDSMTQAERKTRSESRSADKSARNMTYRQAVKDRMKERGIKPPERGPGGGGPGGRGRGPGG